MTPRPTPLFNALLVSLMIALLPLPSAPASEINPEPGVRTDVIGTMDGWTVWVGWNASFSDSYLPESETYNWIIFFAPEGVYAGLTSAASVISSVDVFASIGGFIGMYAAPQKDKLTWGEFTDLNGVTITADLDLLSLPVGPLSGGSLSFSVGPTFFRKGDSLDFVRAYQLNAGCGASFSLISLPMVPSVALDFKSNLTGEDTGFWPILLWDMEVHPDLDPISNVIVQLQRMTAPGADGPVNPVADAMAQRLLPAVLSFQSGAGGAAVDGATPVGNYLGEFLTNSSTALVSGAAAGSVDGSIAAAREWIANEDEEAPAKILSDIPISLGEVLQGLRPVKQGVEAGFEMAYRNGYDKAVEDGTREDNVIYADCVITNYCTAGEECSITVEASEIAALVPGTAAADYEGAYVWFDIPTESFLQEGTAGGEGYIEIAHGKATYTFVQTATYPLLIGAAVDRDYSNEVTEGKNVELCRRLVVFQTPIETDDVTIEGGELTSVSALSPEATPNPDGAPEDMFMGLVAVEIETTPGATVSLSIDLPSPAPAGYSWFKLTADAQWIDLANNPVASTGDKAVFSADRTKVTMTITDDGPLDHDPTPGKIVDPSGLGLTAGFDSSSSSSDSPKDDTSGDGSGCSMTQNASSTGGFVLLFFGLFLLLLIRPSRKRG